MSPPFIFLRQAMMKNEILCLLNVHNFVWDRYIFSCVFISYLKSKEPFKSFEGFYYYLAKESKCSKNVGYETSIAPTFSNSIGASVIQDAIASIIPIR